MFVDTDQDQYNIKEACFTWMAQAIGRVGVVNVKLFEDAICGSITRAVTEIWPKRRIIRGEICNPGSM